MKIISIHVVAFGKLKNVNLQLNSGINVLQHSNGFGKSTLASFIRAMLYGFAYTRTKGVTDVSHYAPWGSTDRFGGSLVVEHNSEIYRIERFFGSTARQETLKVTNERTGKEINLAKQPGEMLLGLTADSYDRSAYYPQEGVELASNDNFDARLANLVEDGANYDKAQDKLRAYKKGLRYERGYGGKIYELEREKQELTRQLYDSQQAERRSAEIDARLQQIQQQKAALTARQSEFGAELQRLQQQPATQTDDNGNTQPSKRSKILLYLGAVALVVGIVFLALGFTNTIGVAAYIIGAICLALGVIVTVAYLVKGRGKKGQTSAAPNSDELKNEHVQDSVNYASLLTELSRQIAELSNEAGRLTEERKNLTIDSVAIQDKILAVDEQQKDAVRRLEVADYAVKLLERAKENLSRSYIPKLCARTSELTREITQNDLSVAVDGSFAVSIREKGQTKPMSEFSRGIREIVLLCFRVALSELLYDGAIPFLIIDDAFVNFDEANFVRATDLLKKLSGAQIVYLTCHDRLGNLLK